ncbi:DUF1056 family protein [Vagococcus sp. BWB3-3]|uniref:DUF1056 family protein n=1 Tax=Vagococcus allomyrinae TaxID=2794353 RepID=A0A940P8G9_9ENTE|nr:DUF1056 family protein [Vagococcus allomyrinae]MBP1040374.1 DUF1056 family protein [Vagococcus allomyrinae]
MRNALFDIIFVIGMLMILYPIFNFNVDLGFFVTGVVLTVIVAIYQRKKGGDDK